MYLSRILHNIISFKLTKVGEVVSALIDLSDVRDASLFSHLIIIAEIQLVFPATHRAERQTMRTAA